MSNIATITNATLRLGGRTLWQHLDITVQPGEFIAVLGPNGAGKSSLLKMLLGMVQPSAGTVKVLNQAPAAARMQVGYIPQQSSFDRDTPMTGRDLVAFGLNGAQWFWRPTNAGHRAQITAAIRQAGAGAYADKPLGRLSGGEQQRLRIAQAIVGTPQLLLCDEPLLSLDLASQKSVSELINAQRAHGTAVIFVTHEINPVLPMVGRVLYIVGGKWAIGTPADILSRETLSKLYGTHIDVVRVHDRVVVVGATEHIGAEPQDTHHHAKGDQA